MRLAKIVTFIAILLVQTTIYAAEPTVQEKYQLIRSSLRTVPDFPKKGINFYDITTLLNSPAAYKTTLDILTEHYRDKKIDGIIAIESRGFILGGALADRLRVPLILARKPGKLPAEKYTAQYEKEYGPDSLEIHKDSLKPGKRVIIIDDLIATGGTIEAVIKLAQQAKLEVVEAAAIIELKALKGRDRIKAPVFAILTE
jgi:adenine phosphoribosyltransferase